MIIGGKPTHETLEAIAEAEKIIRGDIPNIVSEAHPSIIGADQAQQQLSRVVDMGRVVADPAYVRPIDWEEVRKWRDRMWFFHTDAIALFVGKKFDLLSQFFAAAEGTKPPPIYRIRMPRQMMVSGWGGMMDHSLLALEQGEIAILLKGFIAQAVMTRRFTKEQRDRHQTHTGKLLLDQYWEVAGHTVTTMQDGLPLEYMLFLPTGMDFAVAPIPKTDPVKFTTVAADPVVRQAGMMTLTSGHALSVGG